MNLTPISGSEVAARAASAPLASEATAQAPFAELARSFLMEVDADQKAVALDAHLISIGEARSLEQIAANAAQADLSFRFAMELRDRLISAYQEVMRMQM